MHDGDNLELTRRGFPQTSAASLLAAQTTLVKNEGGWCASARLPPRCGPSTPPIADRLGAMEPFAPERLENACLDVSVLRRLGEVRRGHEGALTPA